MQAAGNSQYRSTQRSLGFVEMEKKALEYAEGDVPLLRYIKKVLEDASFISDPKAYFDAWTERKARLNVMRIPSDDAYHFFEMNLFRSFSDL